MSTNLEEQWQPYARLVPFADIAKRLEFPLACLKEAVRFVLPSLRLAKDGPVVESLFLVSEKYICEVRLNQRIHDFDVALLTTIGNYRIETGKHEVTREEPVSKTEQASEERVTKFSYETATVRLRHGYRMSSELTFVGEGRDAWVQHVLSALPIDLLAKSRAG